MSGRAVKEEICRTCFHEPACPWVRRGSCYCWTDRDNPKPIYDIRAAEVAAEFVMVMEEEAGKEKC